MRFLLLLHESDEERLAKSDEEVAVCVAYAQAMEKAGILCGGERLRPAAEGVGVRVEAGSIRVLDGPFADTKEQLGGFHMIDVPDLATAIAWAARCPSALRGRVEVRPVWPV